MNERQRESTGRTVDEAIREALLRMGLRREEVEVTVIQEPRGGILGLGRRQAIVRVVKKSDRSRDGRRPRQDRAGHAAAGRSRVGDERLGGESEGRRDRRRGGRVQGGKDDKGKTDKADTIKPHAGDRRRGAARVAEAREPAAEAKIRAAAEREQPVAAEDSERRRRRPRRRRRKAGAESDIAPPVEIPGTAPGQGQEDRRQMAQAETAPPGTPDASPAISAPDTAPAVAATDDALLFAAPPSEVELPGHDAQDIATDPNRSDADSRASAGTEERVLAAAVAAGEHAEPWIAAAAADMPQFLQRSATDLMVKAGFPCRVQVQPGDYHLVKMVVDDRSAGVLIGRYGNTVDAIEHLVEKIASRAAGGRVRMNLDINNYRLRREDQLVQRARSAANEARDTGEPVALEPAGGRERRIVHLYIQETGDLTTYTAQGPEGKFVVVCRQEQVPAEHRQHSDDGKDDSGGEPIDGAVDIEVGAIIDVDAGGGRDERAPFRGGHA